MSRQIASWKAARRCEGVFCGPRGNIRRTISAQKVYTEGGPAARSGLRRPDQFSGKEVQKMRTKYLVAVLVLLTFAVPASPAHAGGIVSVCDEAHLLAALAGGETVTFSCSGTHTL